MVDNLSVVVTGKCIWEISDDIEQPFVKGKNEFVLVIQPLKGKAEQ
jgi:hypothetical protein